MTTRADVVAEARSWARPKPTRWHHAASRKGVGCDCIGLIVGVARELGIYGAAEFDASPLVRGYGREPDPEMTSKACTFFLDRATAPYQAADIIYLKVPGVAHPMHFAILTACDQMIHSTVTAGKVVEHRLDDVWRSRIVRAYCYRGIA